MNFKYNQSGNSHQIFLLHCRLAHKDVSETFEQTKKRTGCDVPQPRGALEILRTARHLASAAERVVFLAALLEIFKPKRRGLAVAGAR
jgi:hypothetical protein